MLDRLDDDGIDFSDIPELTDSFFAGASLRRPQDKQTVSLPLDRDVLHWFKRQGRGYKARINIILRTYMEAKTKR